MYRRNAHVQSKTNDIKPNKRRYEHEMTLYWVLYVVFGDRSLLLGVSSTFSALLDITKLTRQMTDGRVLLQLLRHSREESKSQHVAYHHIKFHLNGKKFPYYFTHIVSLTHCFLLNLYHTLLNVYLRIYTLAFTAHPSTRQGKRKKIRKRRTNNNT